MPFKAFLIGLIVALMIILTYATIMTHQVQKDRIVPPSTQADQWLNDDVGGEVLEGIDNNDIN